VKGAFMDVPFREKVKLGAVNSINWARVLAQMTYYFYAYYQVLLRKRTGLQWQQNTLLDPESKIVFRPLCTFRLSTE
jgi:hypothetical protein